MAQQVINVGTAPNDGTGDTLKASFTKANANFTELYTRPLGNAYTGSSTAPSAPNVGDLWYDLSTGVLSIRVNDGSSQQWVMVAPSGTSPDYVRSDIAQSFTAAQQTQARSNIYAAPFDAMAYSGMQINGSMEVSQELGTSGTSTNGAFPADGWRLFKNGTMVPFAAVLRVHWLLAFQTCFLCLSARLKPRWVRVIMLIFNRRLRVIAFPVWGGELRGRSPLQLLFGHRISGLGFIAEPFAIARLTVPMHFPTHRPYPVFRNLTSSPSQEIPQGRGLSITTSVYLLYSPMGAAQLIQLHR